MASTSRRDSIDFPTGWLEAGDNGNAASLAQGLVKDGIQQIGTVGAIPSQGVAGKS